MNNKHVKSYQSFCENHIHKRRGGDPVILEARPAFIERLKYILKLPDSEFAKRGKLSYLKVNTKEILVNSPPEFFKFFDNIKLTPEKQNILKKLGLLGGDKIQKIRWIVTLDQDENSPEIKREISNLTWGDYIKLYRKKEIMIRTHEEYASFIRQILNRLLLCILNKEEILTPFDIDIVDIGRYAETLSFGHGGKFSDVNHLGQSEGGPQTFVYTFISYFLQWNSRLFSETESDYYIKKIIEESKYFESDLGLPHLEEIWVSCEDGKKERYITGPSLGNKFPSHYKNVRPHEPSEQEIEDQLKQIGLKSIPKSLNDILDGIIQAREGEDDITQLKQKTAQKEADPSTWSQSRLNDEINQALDRNDLDRVKELSKYLRPKK